jgi:hypothetical protein
MIGFSTTHRSVSIQRIAPVIAMVVAALALVSQSSSN